jgi:hypothetical protein
MKDNHRLDLTIIKIYVCVKEGWMGSGVVLNVHKRKREKERGLCCQTIPHPWDSDRSDVYVGSGSRLGS